MISRRHPVFLLAVLMALGLAACKPRGTGTAAVLNLKAEKAAHATQLLKQEHGQGGLDSPPEGVFDLVHYPSPVGPLGAYLSPDPKDGKKHPLVIWLVGGFDNSISSGFWNSRSVENDQSASAYRHAGIPMMCLSLRGGNDNPGVCEYLYGEVDDVLAATAFARKLDWVDPERIYLGGHSSGAALALLTAESAEPGLFRAILAVGPVASMAEVGQKRLPFDLTDEKEARLRSPIEFLPLINAHTVIVEGEGGSAASLKRLRQRSRNEHLSFTLVEGYNHFSVLAPANEVLASKVLNDTGPVSDISITAKEIKAASKSIANAKLIPAGDVHSKSARNGVVFYHAAGSPEIKDVIQEIAARDFKDLPIYSNFKEAEKPPFLVISEEKAPFEDLPVPDADYFKFAGRGMEAEDIKAVQKSEVATAIYLVSDTKHIWETGKNLMPSLGNARKRPDPISGTLLLESASLAMPGKRSGSKAGATRRSPISAARLPYTATIPIMTAPIPESSPWGWRNSGCQTSSSLNQAPRNPVLRRV